MQSSLQKDPYEKKRELMETEKLHTGTSKTNNEKFEKDGYLKIENICDPEELYSPLPFLRGNYTYGLDVNDVTHVGDDEQVPGGLSRYHYPYYRKIHKTLCKKVEDIIGKKLYPTYYFDRYYFPGQELEKHTDRPSCEISVSVHISNNLPDNLKDLPLYIKTPDTYTDDKKDIISVGQERSLVLNPGDGMIYKGCERPHWRNPIPIPPNNSKNRLFGLFNKSHSKSSDNYYYHQIFFHYVLQDGERAYFAWDMQQNSIKGVNV